MLKTAHLPFIPSLFPTEPVMCENYIEMFMLTGDVLHKVLAYLT